MASLLSPMSGNAASVFLQLPPTPQTDEGSEELADSDEEPVSPEERAAAVAERKRFVADLTERRRQSAKILAWLHDTGRQMLADRAAEDSLRLDDLSSTDLSGRKLPFGGTCIQENDSKSLGDLRTPPTDSVDGRGRTPSRRSEGLARIPSSGAEAERSVEKFLLDTAPPAEWTRVPDEELDLNGRETYIIACRRQRVNPVSKVLEKLDEPVVDLANYHLGERGGVALAACLERNAAVQFIDLSDTGLDLKSGSAILRTLVKNLSLLSLDLSHNRIFEQPAKERSENAARLRQLSSASFKDFRAQRLPEWRRKHADALPQDAPRAMLKQWFDSPSNPLMRRAEELQVDSEARDLVIWSFIKPVEDGTGGDPAARLAAAENEAAEVQEKVVQLILEREDRERFEDALGPLMVNRTLVSLSLKGSQLTDSAIQVLVETVMGNDCLARLDLSNNRLTAHACGPLSELPAACAHLRELELANNRLGWRACYRPKCTCGLGGPQSACKCGAKPGSNYRGFTCEICGSPMKILTGLLADPNAQLRLLGLAGNGLGDAGAIALLDGLSTNRHLQIIDLSRNHIGPAGCWWVMKQVERITSRRILASENSESGDLPLIRTLHLGGNPLVTPVEGVKSANYRIKSKSKGSDNGKKTGKKGKDKGKGEGKGKAQQKGKGGGTATAEDTSQKPRVEPTAEELHADEVAQLFALDEKSWAKATAAPTTGLSALIAPLPAGVAPKTSWVEAGLLRSLEACDELTALGLEGTALSHSTLARVAEVTLVRRSAAMDFALLERYGWCVRSQHFGEEESIDDRREDWPPEEVRVPAFDTEEGQKEPEAVARGLARAMVASLRFNAVVNEPDKKERERGVYSTAPAGFSVSTGSIAGHRHLHHHRKMSGQRYRHQHRPRLMPHPGTGPQSGGRRLLQPLLRGEKSGRGGDSATQWRGLLSVDDMECRSSVLWVRNILEELEHARRRKNGDWSDYGFTQPAPKLIKTHSSSLKIKRWDEEKTSGDREQYGATSALSKAAAEQEVEMAALVALVSYCDRDESV